MKRLFKILFLPKEVYELIINRITFYRKSITYTNFPQIQGVVLITGRGSIRFGHSVKLNSSRRSNPIGGDNKVIIDLGTKGKLNIGSNSGLSNCTIVCHSSVNIGEYVKIGGSVKIYDTDFHHLNATDRANPETDQPKQMTQIYHNLSVNRIL